jgi:hypothetical protein
VDLFEVKTRVERILAEMPVGFASLSLNVVRQQGKQFSEPSGRS